MQRAFFLVLGTALLGWLAFGVFGVQALFTDRIVQEEVPIVRESTSSTHPALSILAQGTFEQGDSTYTIQGKAAISEEDGVRTLSLIDFDVTNGPDLFVYLVSSTASDNVSVKTAVRAQTFMNLGELKGNKGNQTYVIPEGVELNSASVVSIWCRRFSRNFGAATMKF